MITPEIKELLDSIKNYNRPGYLIAEEHEPLISVGEIVSKAARYYEKARYSVDYTEDHLLRQTAIERILRRRLTIDFMEEKNGRAFVVELIQAGYLPNNELPERITFHVQAIIDKTVFFLSILKKIYPNEKFAELRPVVIKLATSELEELLFPEIVEAVTVKAFHKKIKEHVVVTEPEKTKCDVGIQIYLACRKGLLKENDTSSFYSLWLMLYPEWKELNNATAENDEQIKQIAEEFATVENNIQKELSAVLYRRIIPRLKNDIIYFSIIQKIVTEHKEGSLEIFESPESLYFATSDKAEIEYEKIRSRMNKTAWHAIIYIFITKILLALAVELPYDMMVYGYVHTLPLFINATFHPFLLYLMTSKIKKPSDLNTERIGKGVRAAVHDVNHDDIKLSSVKKSSPLRTVATLLYICFFFATFGVIIWGLKQIQFNIIGMGLFVLFLTFVSYFGLRVRFISQRWVVQTNEQHFFAFVWDLVTLPVISLGQWLSIKFQSINIFVFVLDFIIEAPFKVILQALDTFTLYVKEKKDEIY
jgi:hypothetical protein